MTNEQHFQDMLDQNPEDHQTRMILADFLDDAGDPRAAGYRALGKLGVMPVSYKGSHWHSWDVFPEMKSSTSIPKDWLDQVDKGHDGSRKGAEDAAAHAFSKLPPERQSELLGHTTPEQMQWMARARRKMKADEEDGGVEITSK